MFIRFEIDPPFLWRPGWYGTRINRNLYVRAHWLFFAVAYYAGSADEFMANVKGWCDEKGWNE